MYLKIKNICLKICIEICMSKKNMKIFILLFKNQKHIFDWMYQT